MTTFAPLPVTTPIDTYVAAPAQAQFPYTFFISRGADLLVFVNGVLQPGNSYLVSNVDELTGGDITFLVPMLGGEEVTLAREVVLERETGFLEGGRFRSTALNLELTRLVAMHQDIRRDVDRSFRLPVGLGTLSGVSVELPVPVPNRSFKWNSNGTGLVLTQFDPDTLVSDAQGFRDEAEGFRNEAEGFRNEAEGFRDEAEGFRDAAEGYRDFANAWATAPEDEVVDDGENPADHSAFHYSRKANAWATTAPDVIVDDGVNPPDYSAKHYANKAEHANLTVPIGTQLFITGNTVPAGYLLADGSQVDELYPDLRQYLIDAGSPYGTSLDGHPFLPDMLSDELFVRAVASVDVGRVQSESYNSLVEVTNISQPPAVSTGTLAIPQDGTESSIFRTGNNQGNNIGISLRNSGNPIHPKNIGYLPVIKAYDSVNIQGQVDLEVLLNAIATQSEAINGVNNTKAMTALRTKQHVDARSFVSAPQSFLGAGEVHVVPHTLGVKPKEVQIELLCVADNNGWVIGDRLDSGAFCFSAGSTGNHLNCVLSDEDEVTVITNSNNANLRLVNASTGASVDSPQTNWQFIVHAYA